MLGLATIFVSQYSDIVDSVVMTGLVKVILGYVPGGRVPSYTKTEVWTTVHVGMAIVCACLPVCWPLMRHFYNHKIRSYLSIGVKSPSTQTISSGGDTDPPMSFV